MAKFCVGDSVRLRKFYALRANDSKVGTVVGVEELQLASRTVQQCTVDFSGERVHLLDPFLEFHPTDEKSDEATATEATLGGSYVH